MAVLNKQVGGGKPLPTTSRFVYERDILYSRLFVDCLYLIVYSQDLALCLVDSQSSAEPIRSGTSHQAVSGSHAG